MPVMHMDPAKSILDLIGVETAAKVTGKHISRVYRWTYPASRGGTGGIIPHTEALKLLEHARATKIPLNEADFMRSPSIASEQQGAA
jgi:hypothetical protein